MQISKPTAKLLSKAYLSTQFKIESIAHHEQLLETVALWHHKESLVGREPVEDVEFARQLQKRVGVLNQHLSSAAIPNTFIAFMGDEPVGSTSLVHYQFTKSQPRSEWLTNIYVAPNYRNRGVARKLIEYTCAFAAEQGVSLLNLYTTDKGLFYQHLGWHMSGTAYIQGEHVEIYKKNIAP